MDFDRELTSNTRCRSPDGTGCDDTDEATYPGATEIVGDGIDPNCDGWDTPEGVACGGCKAGAIGVPSGIGAVWVLGP